MSFARVVVTAGLTSLTLGVLARSWSWMRHGPARTVPPSDCPPKGAHIAGLAVARREQGALRAANVLVLVHDRDERGPAMLERVRGLPGPRLELAPTGPMPTAEGAAWTWARPTDPAFGEAIQSAAGLLARFLVEVRRCNPGRRLVAAGHGQGAHVLLTAAAFDPTLADALVLAGAALPEDLIPAALPSTVLLHAPFDPLAAELAALGLPVRARPRLDAGGDLSGPLLAAWLAELAQALTPS